MTNEEIITQVEVSARANIFCAGLTAIPPDITEGGELPPRVEIGPGRNRIVKVAAIKVHTCINPATEVFNRLHGPDGSRYTDGYNFSPPRAMHTNFRANHGVSGIKAVERAMFLTGVFMPRRDVGPGVVESLRFGVRPEDSRHHEYINYDFERLEPRPRQTFFMGDGLTGIVGGKPEDEDAEEWCRKAGTGKQQEFVVPVGAGTLYLGFADGDYFGNNSELDIDYIGGLPGYYDKNQGQLTVTLSITGAWHPEGEEDKER